MADNTSNLPYPMQFDPSQWSNPYSNYYGKALPFPASYAGTPTNALGQPIAVPQGMTLNQTPAQPQAPQSPGFLQPGMQGYQGQPIRMATTSEGMPSGETSLGRGVVVGQPQQQQPMMQSPAQAPMAAPQAGNNWQTTLAMLANPGKVTTPGATVPQASSSATPGPGVLQSFLANWQPAQSGAGAGFTQNFNTILRGLQAQKGS